MVVVVMLGCVLSMFFILFGDMLNLFVMMSFFR